MSVGVIFLTGQWTRGVERRRGGLVISMEGSGRVCLKILNFARLI